MSGARPDPAAGDIPTDEQAEHRVRPRFVVDLDKAESTEDRRKRNAHPDARAARREYMSTPEGQAANRKAQENYRADHPERVAAQQKARTTHGESAESTHKCAKCDAKGTHKHHTDYEGGPVQWLCHTHHVKAHHPKSDLGKSAVLNRHDTTGSKKDSMKKNECADSGPAQAAGEPYAKCGSSMSWYDKFLNTPLYADALAIEREYLNSERDRKSDSTGETAWQKYDKARQKLGVKWLDFMIKQEKQHTEKSMIEKTRNDLFKSIMGRDPYEAGPTDLAKAMPPWLKPKDGEAKKSDDADEDDVKPGASPADKKKAFAAKFKKAFAEAKKALDAVAAMRKSDGAGGVGGGLSSVPMVDHPRPGPSTTMGATDGGDPSTANTTTVPMVDHPRPGGGGAMDKSAKKTPDPDDAYAEAMGKARAAMDECMKSFVGYAELGDGLGAGAGSLNASSTVPGGPSISDGEPFGSLSGMHGMPSPNQGAETQLSEDDTSIAGELSTGTKPLESHAPSHGASGLEASVHQRMGGDASASASGGMSKSGALAPSYEYAKQLAERRQAGSSGLRAIVGSGSEDERIAGHLAKSEAAGRKGNLQAEPVQLRPRAVPQVRIPFGLVIPND